ncbi:MAG: helix-turn-helix transcriptional regulator [Burkholderiales bacterium]|nr:helix-turn-helix transcriptional regulator [Burkholderiales bacterium]
MPRKAPPRRRSGRPRLADGAAARDALLDAAVALIAERGVAGTSSAEIAARADVTPAMIHYYFRKREALLDAVVDERLARFVAAVFGSPLPETSARDLVTAIVHRVYAAAARMPWMPPIWIREIVSDGGALRSRMLEHFPAQATLRLIDIVARDRKAGRVPAGIEPRLAFVTVAGVAMLPLAVRSLWGRLPGLAGLDERALETHARTVRTAGLAPARKERRT